MTTGGRAVTIRTCTSLPPTTEPAAQRCRATLALCLVLGRGGFEAAADYAKAATDRRDDRTVFEVEIDLSGLVIEEIEVNPRDCWD